MTKKYIDGPGFYNHRDGLFFWFFWLDFATYAWNNKRARRYHDYGSASTLRPRALNIGIIESNPQVLDPQHSIVLLKHSSIA